MTHPPTDHSARNAYWRWNLAYMGALLTLWAAVSFGLGIAAAPYLNTYEPFGIPLGFWFAQQGSIATFVIIILAYALLMNRLDRWYHDQVASSQPAQTP
ncbi:DUF4212 domain-containing protein [Mucisphaera calidilacus]|uniref:Sodium symporter small subunit domain-containing protein n=1 Tax=Mucisphaera calidilacus TaxID=2527982 RepID=A0A518BVV0_9BACT|nr:DUF4212 domain-containing protein [Mucisphaera calidilacus]QDU71106.1 hypothetical protein Pan265_09540 [Mucisphaera calidilacus]